MCIRDRCVPVSMTGRIFFWNMTTFNKAGITEVPKSLDDLMAAGKAFKEKLGDDYYPMHLGCLLYTSWKSVLLRPFGGVKKHRQRHILRCCVDCACGPGINLYTRLL